MIGQVLNDCKIEEKLILASTGRIYKAIDTKLEVPRAVKIIHPQLAEKEPVRQRFRLALQAWAKLDIPSFVQVFSAIDTEDMLGYVMDYIDGVSLESLIKKQGHLGISQAVEYFLQIARAISFAHDRQILHRKLYPGNVIVCRDENIKIMGLGASREIGTKRVTPQNLCIGKIKYMAPEQFSGTYSIHTDQYTLGVMLYEMITGNVPFDGTTISSIVKMHMAQKPAPPGKINNEVSPELEKIILTALAKKPENRFPDVKTFINEIVSVSDRVDFTTDLSVHSLMSHARKAQERRKLENAIYFFNKVLSLYGRETQYFEEAHRSRTQAIRLQKEEDDLRSIRDWTQESLGHYDEEEVEDALSYVAKVLQVARRYPKSSRIEGVRQDLIREMPELVEEAEAQIKKEMDKSHRVLKQAQESLEQENFEDAIELVDDALRHDVNNKQAKQLKTVATRRMKISKVTEAYTDGLVAMKNGLYSSAIASFQRVIEINPDHENALKYREMAQKAHQEQIARKAEIEKTYREALKFYETWKYDESIEKFKKVLSLDPHHKEARQFLSQSEDRLNDEDTLEDIGFFYQKGTSFYKEKQWREAIVCYNRVLKCMDTHKKALEYIGYAQQELERQELFERVKEEGLLLFGQNAYSDALERFDYLAKLTTEVDEEIVKYQCLCREFIQSESENQSEKT